MSPTRFLCVDVGEADDALAVHAVTRAIAMASSWDRLVCFGRAAVIAARLERQERAERDGVWLDVSANWLLAVDDGRAQPPVRPAPGPLAEKATAIGKPGLDAGALPVSERLVELVGGLLVMAVPSARHMDDVDNAHLWLVGGAPVGVDTAQGKAGGRAIVGVAGGIVGVAIVGAEATVTPWNLQGDIGTPTTVALGGASRFSVRSALA